MRVIYILAIRLHLVFWCWLPFQQTAAQSGLKPRIIITADPELDDNNSLIRFLLYSTDVQVEGLIYASSQFHWKGDGKQMVEGDRFDYFGMDGYTDAELKAKGYIVWMPV